MDPSSTQRLTGAVDSLIDALHSFRRQLLESTTNYTLPSVDTLLTAAAPSVPTPQLSSPVLQRDAAVPVLPPIPKARTTQPPARSSITTNDSTCVFCDQPHHYNKCPLEPDQKRRRVAAKMLCVKCLGPDDHAMVNCRGQRCSICTANHITLVCTKASGTKNPPTTRPSKPIVTAPRHTSPHRSFNKPVVATDRPSRSPVRTSSSSKPRTPSDSPPFRYRHEDKELLEEQARKSRAARVPPTKPRHVAPRKEQPPVPHADATLGHHSAITPLSAIRVRPPKLPHRSERKRLSSEGGPPEKKHKEKEAPIGNQEEIINLDELFGTSSSL